MDAFFDDPLPPLFGPLLSLDKNHEACDSLAFIDPGRDWTSGGLRVILSDCDPIRGRCGEDDDHTKEIY